MPEDDPMHRKPVIDLARKQLKWQPTVSLEQGLNTTIDSFRKVRDLEISLRRRFNASAALVLVTSADQPWR